MHALLYSFQSNSKNHAKREQQHSTSIDSDLSAIETKDTQDPTDDDLSVLLLPLTVLIHEQVIYLVVKKHTVMADIRLQLGGRSYAS